MFNTQINAGAIKSKPVNMHFGKRHVYRIVAKADEAGSLNSKHFKLKAPYPRPTIEDNIATIVPWFNVGGTGVAPVIEGAILVPVEIAEDATLLQVHTALETALKTKNDYIKLCWIENGALFVEVMWFGIVESAEDVDTDFVFTDFIKGFGGFLGGTEGGANITPEVATEEITTDQTGATTPIAEIIQSTKFTVATTMKELSQKRMELLFGTFVGEVFTPEGGTKVIGLGTSKVGQNTSLYTGELIMQPVTKEATDHSENIHFFSCAILPGGINYGSEQLKTEVTFNAYVDANKDKRANIGCFGNGFQDLRPVA